MSNISDFYFSVYSLLQQTKYKVLLDQLLDYYVEYVPETEDFKEHIVDHTLYFLSLYETLSEEGYYIFFYFLITTVSFPSLAQSIILNKSMPVIIASFYEYLIP